MAAALHFAVVTRYPHHAPVLGLDFDDACVACGVNRAARIQMAHDPIEHFLAHVALTVASGSSRYALID